MLILGIESTAHTFGIGIINAKTKEILFNEKSQYKEVDGMDLRKLQEFHVANFDKVLIKAKEFLKTIGKGFKDLDLISFSQGPGIGNALKVGALCAKTLSLKFDVPIIGVNHIKAHLEIGKMLTELDEPIFLYVSGVNTQIIAKDDTQKYKIYGETEDIGLGNLFDSFAREAGFTFPGGPKIEKLALKSKNYIELPCKIKGMNISLAGLSSNLKQKLNSKNYKIEDLCFSLQEITFATLMEIVERAIAYTQKKEFVIVGGVASNKRLNKMAKEMCKLRKVKYKSFPSEYAMDNGAMIAWQGFLEVGGERLVIRGKRLEVRGKRKEVGGEKSERREEKKDWRVERKSIKGLKPTPYINIES